MAIAKVLLLTVLITAIFGTHILMLENGLIDRMRAAIESKRIPETEYALKTSWTGITPVDDFLSLMVCFFAAVDWRTHLPLFVQGLHFLGQLAAIWMLVIVEGLRSGNAGKAIANVVPWGLGVELIGMAIIMPIYYLTHLLSSPIAAFTRSSPASFKESLLVDPSKAGVLPWAVFFGHFVPAISMLVTKESVIEPIWASKQFWMLARLFHPLFTAIFLGIFSSMTAGPSPISAAASGQRYTRSMAALRKVYSFATLLAVTTHVSTVSLTIFQIVGITLADPRQPLSLTAVFWPVHFWTKPVPQVSTSAFGVHAFLQWDELVSCTATFIWAVAITSPVFVKEGGVFYLGRGLFNAILMLLIGGPAAAAIYLVEKRDEIVMSKENPDQKR